MKSTGLKKNFSHKTKDKIKLIESSNENIPIIRQCELLGISRSNYYYKPVPINERELLIMGKIDEIYTDFPYYGSPKITHAINKQGIKVNHKMIERLMNKMGLAAIFPKKNTSKSHLNCFKYPYLLKNLAITRINQVWGTDITYIRAHRQWFYLVAIINWYSRFVISWKLSRALLSDFCVEVLDKALHTAVPEIHNSDQGSQFTSEEYTSKLKSKNIQISMDGQGRCFDNIFTERLWRSVKYEEVYPHDYQSFEEAEQSLQNYFYAYNYKRLHESLGYRTPAEIYLQSKNNGINKINNGIEFSKVAIPSIN